MYLIIPGNRDKKTIVTITNSRCLTIAGKAVPRKYPAKVILSTHDVPPTIL